MPTTSRQDATFYGRWQVDYKSSCTSEITLFPGTQSRTPTIYFPGKGWEFTLPTMLLVLDYTDIKLTTRGPRTFQKALDRMKENHITIPQLYDRLTTYCETVEALDDLKKPLSIAEWAEQRIATALAQPPWN